MLRGSLVGPGGDLSPPSDIDRNVTDPEDAVKFQRV